MHENGAAAYNLSFIYISRLILFAVLQVPVDNTMVKNAAVSQIESFRVSFSVMDFAIVRDGVIYNRLFHEKCS